MIGGFFSKGMTDQNQKTQVIPQTPYVTQVHTLLTQVQEAARRGQRQMAYQLALEATRVDPNSADAWFFRSRLAPSNEESLFCMSQVNRLNPQHPWVKQDSYNLIWGMLEKDPFLAYQDETDDLYLVRSSAYMSLAIPKDRSTPVPFPPKQPGRLARSYHWLGLALLGMLFSGIGALVFAPLAILSALSTFTTSLSQADRVRAGVVILGGILMVFAGALLTWLLYAHFRG